MGVRAEPVYRRHRVQVPPTKPGIWTTHRPNLQAEHFGEGPDRPTKIFPLVKQPSKDKERNVMHLIILVLA
ncbi:unnamed protein product [Acanthoscelides obtectus]|uniref:Uncharacterized protein n=1 Tax=Acanthoscelides obtectus TaxID=200917 RepID=A0A9P0P9M5_ACAOB|nr:unnamed protein product [Acanthoscelides obtectus]CAK1655853.1 hypothetical protein AOBTE_LOCUS19391 [Acanthoscelides obtectus]